MEAVRIYEIPACKMVVSGGGLFGDGVLEKFMEWMDSQKRSLFPRDFLSFDGQNFIWYYVYDEGMEVPEDLKIVDFEGGLYAVAAGRDGDDADAQDAKRAIDEFIRKNPRFERDCSRAELGNIITSPSAEAALGYNQMDYYTPIRLKQN